MKLFTKCRGSVFFTYSEADFEDFWDEIDEYLLDNYEDETDPDIDDHYMDVFPLFFFDDEYVEN